MKHKYIDGDEMDALGYKNWFRWRAGMRKYAKRKANKRERREARAALKEET